MKINNINNIGIFSYNGNSNKKAVQLPLSQKGEVLRFSGNISLPLSFKSAINELDKYQRTQSKDSFVYSDEKQKKVVSDEVRRQRCKEFELSSYETKKILELDDVQYAKIERLIAKGVSCCIAQTIIELDDAQYAKFEELIDKGVSCSFASTVLKIDDKQYKRFVSCIDKGFDEITAAEASEMMNDSQFSRFENLTENGVNAEKAAELAFCLCDDYSVLPLLKRFDVIKELKRIEVTLDPNEFDIGAEIDKARSSLKQTVTTTDTSNADITKMMQGFFTNNNADLDNLLSTTDFAKYGKNGIPLTYSRTEFLGDLSDELKKIPVETQEKITKKLGIETIQDRNGNITGYNGIIDLTKLSADGSEGEILSLANRFIKENSVTTGDSELDNALNSLIQGMPEFVNVIGKQQHATHDLSVDSHILSVLQNVMSNPQYEKLSNKDKFCLKFATVLHDIAKSEGIIDDGHAEVSALYARDILNKPYMNMSIETKNRIYEFVKNHHWLKSYNTGEISAERVATIFRRTGDLTAAKIFAEADLKGVSEKFYNKYKSALSDEKQAPITISLDKINSTGQICLTNSIIDKSKIPTVECKGKTYQVINFNELSKDTDLQQYGFEPNTTVENLKLLVHMCSTLAVSEKLLLADSANQGFLSTSTLSVLTGGKTTFCCKPVGVALNAENVNIANAYPFDQVSGSGKQYERFLNVVEGNDCTSEYRNKIPSAIKKTLNLTDSEYSELYSKLQKYKHLSQLDNISPVSVGDKIFTGSQIKEALKNADISINVVGYNELNVYSPQVNAIVAKFKELDEVPQMLLDCAEKYNLPIFLLGYY